MGKALKRWWPLFMLPTCLAFMIGFVIPFIQGFYLSFCQFITISNAHFVGIENYVRAVRSAVLPRRSSLPWRLPSCRRCSST